jgi:hypothetical protein
VWRASSIAGGAAVRFRRWSPLGVRGGELMVVEHEEVVGGRDQPPLGPGGGSASSVESGDLAVELGVGEDGLDHRLPFAVELAAAVGAQTRRMNA